MAILQELQRMGKTIIISSHILRELETLCNRVAIIEKGTLIYSGPVQGVRDQMATGNVLWVRVAGDAAPAIELLRARPEIARIRGVSSESAVNSLSERGLIEEAGRSRFGTAIYRTSPLFEKVFGLDGLEALPDPSRFDPTPDDEREIRERLLAAGEQRSEA